MNRKMTLFAFAGKCDAFGASGLLIFVVGAAMRLESAIEPTPMAQLLKK